MVIDFNWSGGLVVGLIHMSEAVVEVEEDKFEFCHAVILYLGFFQIAILFYSE